MLTKTRVEGRSLAEHLKRPEVDWEAVLAMAPAEQAAELDAALPEAAEQALYDTKYAGYVARQQTEIDRQRRLADKRIPASFDYDRITQMRHEAREKLSRLRPIDLAQASRVSGVTPADIALLMAHLDDPKRLAEAT